MKKIYESPVVELTGFSVEDVITTSVIGEIDTTTDATGFAEAVEAKYAGATTVDVQAYSSYQW